MHTLLGYYFAAQEIGKLPASWLAATINMAVVMHTRPDTFARFNRMLRAKPSMSSFLTLTTKDLIAVLKSTDREQADRQVLEMQLQAFALAQYMLFSDDQRRDTFQAFLASASARKKDAAERLAAEFGCDGEELMRRCYACAMQQPTENAHSLPDPVRRQIRDVAMPTAGNSNLEVEQRREAVRVLGASGSYQCFDLLLGLARHDHGGLRTDALQSLQLLTGETFGDDLDRWDRWWAAHPALQVANAEPVAATAVEPVMAQLADEETSTSAVVPASADANATAAQPTDDSSTAPEPIAGQRVPVRVLATWWLLGIGGVAAILRSVVAAFGWGLEPYAGDWYTMLLYGSISWLLYLNLGAGRVRAHPRRWPLSAVTGHRLPGAVRLRAGLRYVCLAARA